MVKPVYSPPDSPEKFDPNILEKDKEGKEAHTGAKRAAPASRKATTALASSSSSAVVNPSSASTPASKESPTRHAKKKKQIKIGKRR